MDDNVFFGVHSLHDNVSAKIAPSCGDRWLKQSSVAHMHYEYPSVVLCWLQSNLRDRFNINITHHLLLLTCVLPKMTCVNQRHSRESQKSIVQSDLAELNSTENYFVLSFNRLAWR